MQFRHLKPGDFFRFRAQAGHNWRDQSMYRKAGEHTYHRSNKILPMFVAPSGNLLVTPEGSDAMHHASPSESESIVEFESAPHGA